MAISFAEMSRRKDVSEAENKRKRESAALTAASKRRATEEKKDTRRVELASLGVAALKKLRAKHAAMQRRSR